MSLFWVWGGALGAVAIGAAYFARADPSARVSQRVVSSSYAPATAIVFLLGVMVPRETWLALGRGSFLAAQLLPLALLGYCLVAYRGARAAHLVLLPLALLCWLWQVGIGTLLIYGK